MPSFLPKPPSPVLQRGDPGARGLAGAWPFYEGSGSVLHDLSGNGANGTFTNGPTWAASPLGSAVNFAGAGLNQHIHALNPLGPVTVSAFTLLGWANPFSSTTILRWGIGATAVPIHHIEIWLDGNIYFEMRTAGFDVFPTIPWRAGWHLYGMVYDGTQATKLTAYVDGVVQTLTGSQAAITSSVLLNSDFTLGGQTTDAAGQLAQVELLSRALSGNEMMQRFQDSFRLYRPRSRLWEYAVSAPVVAAVPRIFVDA